MEILPFQLTQLLLLLLLQFNLGKCSSFHSTSESPKSGGNSLTARSTREVQFTDCEEKESCPSIASDTTDNSDNEETTGESLDDFGVSGWINFATMQSSRPLIFPGLIDDNSGGFDYSGWGSSSSVGSIGVSSCYSESGAGGPCYGSGGGSCVKSGEVVVVEEKLELDDSGLTSILSERDSFDSETEITRSKFDFKEPAQLAQASAETNFIFGEFVISETCSLASDWDAAEVDCFDRFPIYRASSHFIFEVLIPFFQSGMRLTKFNANQILEFAIYAFKHDATIEDIGINEGETLFVVGDIHGQFEDLVRIFEQNGRPAYDKKFIFNGDIVDRGPKSLECLLTLFLLKIENPYSIFITRGNHESHSCGDGSFKEECYEKMDEEFFYACHEVFNILPLAYIISHKYFVCHGGIPSLFCVDELRNAGKPNYTPKEYSLVYALLWNDPHEGEGMKRSRRGGTTFSFGCDITKDFLQRHGFELLIRSHEYHRDGHFFSHNNQCLTVFSAPNYCGIGNMGTVVRIQPDLRFDIVPIVNPDTACTLTVSSYSRREKERSMTTVEEENEFVFVIPREPPAAAAQDTEDVIEEEF